MKAEKAKFLYMRLDPSLHATIKAAAAIQGVSMQVLVAGILDERFRGAEPGGIMARRRDIAAAAEQETRRRSRKGGRRVAR